MSFDFEAYRAKKRHTAREKAEYILACEEIRESTISGSLDEFENAIRDAAEACVKRHPEFAKDIYKIARKALKAIGRYDMN